MTTLTFSLTRCSLPWSISLGEQFIYRILGGSIPNKHYIRSRFVCTWGSNQTMVAHLNEHFLDACTFTHHASTCWHWQWHWLCALHWKIFFISISVFASFHWFCSLPVFVYFRADFCDFCHSTKEFFELWLYTMWHQLFQ